MADAGDSYYPLHKSVFDNDLKNLSRLLRKHDVAAKDKHGKFLFDFQTSTVTFCARCCCFVRLIPFVTFTTQ